MPEAATLIVGIACVSWCGLELARLARRASGSGRAVARRSDGGAIVIPLDRRRRGRRTRD